MRIGDIQLKSNLMFAPIAGFSDAGARHLSARFGAGLLYTEMVSAKGLCYGGRGTEDLLHTTDTKVPTAVQIFGSEPEYIYKACKDERLQKFDIIDINMGCPVRKIVTTGEGSALMENPSLIEEIVASAKEGGKRPVTVKIRAGVKMGEILAVECALAAEKGGADMVAVHPRFREQMYAGFADHTITKMVKDAVKIPVVANGDIVDKSSFEKVKEVSGADGFMIARGALGKPYIFSQLQGIEYTYDNKSAVLEHIEILRSTLPDRVVANMMKLHLCHYAKNTGNTKAVRMALATASDLDGILKLVDEYL
ncbi:MAG: tRNA-dihydrouridine synthase family protein [Clostridia bacterium]|nr:tRNA-dihydrouridine synthase family protein [Clostridia bacterium]